jgi:hypothetical protein
MLATRFLPLILLSLFFRSGPALGVATDSDWAHRWWVQKTVRALRAGKGFLPTEDPETFVTLDPKALVEHLVHAPEFADAVLNFNLHFLGFPVDAIRYENGNYTNALFSVPHAITSAKAFLQMNGDYFSLLQIAQPLYFAPLSRPPNLDPGDPLLDSITLRNKNMALWLSRLDGVIALASQTPTPTLQQVCAKYQQDSNTVFTLYLPGDFVRLALLSPGWYNAPRAVCYRKPTPPVADFLQSVTDVRKKTAQFFSNLNDYDPARYSTPDLNGIRIYDLGALGLPISPNQFTFTVSLLTRNDRSST